MISQFQKGDTLVLIYQTGESFEFECKCAAQDGTFVILSEGPGLSRIVRWDGGANTWRADGHAVRIARKESNE